MKTTSKQNHRIRERLKGLPQDQEQFVRTLAIAKAKVSRATWERVIRGQSEQFGLLKSLAEVLKISIDDLINPTLPLKDPRWTQETATKELIAIEAGLTSEPETV